MKPHSTDPGSPLPKSENASMWGNFPWLNRGWMAVIATSP